MIINEKRLQIENIAGVQEIDDSAAESVNAGSFFFDRNGGDEGPFTPLTTLTQPANPEDTSVRLLSNDPTEAGLLGANTGAIANNRFTIAIHNSTTGENLFQVRDEQTPARSGQRIDVNLAFGLLARMGDINANTRVEYRIRQIVDRDVCAAGGCTPSDRRLKNNIKDLGFLPELGIKLYSWKYRNEDSTRYVGVMAQDLLARPDLAHAVVIAETGELAGYYTVNYEALGLSMTTEAEWDTKGLKAVMQPATVCV